MEYPLMTNIPCPKCKRELEYVYEPTVVHHIKSKDLPQSKKFIPVYYQDQLWYYRRSPKNTRKAQIKALHKSIADSKSSVKIMHKADFRGMIRSEE